MLITVKKWTDKFWITLAVVVVAVCFGIFTPQQAGMLLILLSIEVDKTE